MDCVNSELSDTSLLDCNIQDAAGRHVEGLDGLIAVDNLVCLKIINEC